MYVGIFIYVQYDLQLLESTDVIHFEDNIRKHEYFIRDLGEFNLQVQMEYELANTLQYHVM